MAYVCLSRCQDKNDIYIKGKVDPAGIHASPEALEETKRLDKIFDDNVQKQNDLKESHWIISYLNVRSLNLHKEDVRIDNVIMESDIFSLGETHLKPGETVDFDGYEGVFANAGKGKGVALFSKLNCRLVHSVATSTISAMYLQTDNFDLIFLYLSKGFNNEELFNLLEGWIDNTRPTAIMGDMNWDFSKDCKMKKFMETKKFHQLIERSTCDTGSLLDMIFANEALMSLKVFCQQSAAYYTDHDIISLLIPKSQ